MTPTTFHAGASGPWHIRAITAVAGDGLPSADRLDVGPGASPTPADPAWTLAGVATHLRYATRAEVDTLRARQPELGRPSARRAALIPIRKSAAWWALAQDERRAIFEETSHHTAIGMAYLPAVARKLYHARDLGAPFDFLTWFEYAPDDEPAFDDLLARLRATAEWTYVTREVDVRLERAP
jgi:chlorite dismutase